MREKGFIALAKGREGYSHERKEGDGATTLSITTFSLMTLSILTLSTMTFSITVKM